MLMLILTVAQRELEPDEQGVTPVVEFWRAMIDEPDRKTPHAVIDGRDRDTVLKRALQEYDRVAHEHKRERAEPGAEGEAAGDPPAPPAPARRFILTGAEDDEPGAEPPADAAAGPGAGPAADRKSELRRRKRVVEAAAGKLNLTDQQIAAALTSALELEPIPEQMVGLPIRGRRFAIGMLTLQSVAGLFDGRPFWCASVSLRYEDERGNEIRLGGETRGRTKDLARASALAHAMLDGVGEWRDQLQLGAEGYLLHRRRPLHDEELRALASALPAAAENEAPVGADGAWEEKAENYRRIIEMASEHPPEPGPRLLT